MPSITRLVGSGTAWLVDAEKVPSVEVESITNVPTVVAKLCSPLISAGPDVGPSGLFKS
jgi:hypothetical protein